MIGSISAPTFTGIVFLALFIGGLVVGVFLMLNGPMIRSRAFSYGDVRVLPSTISVFAAGFGAGGYLALRHFDQPVAAALGVASAFALLLALFWSRVAGRAFSNPVEQEEDMHGLFAIVSSTIAGAAAGEITFDHSGKTNKCPALSVDTRKFAVGTEVVIDHLENGVAYVEDWVTVKERI